MKISYAFDRYIYQAEVNVQYSKNKQHRSLGNRDVTVGDKGFIILLHLVYLALRHVLGKFSITFTFNQY